MMNKTDSRHKKFRDAKRKVSLGGGIMLGDKQCYGVMLEDKHTTRNLGFNDAKFAS